MHVSATATAAGTLGITATQLLWGYATLCAIGAIGVWQERRRALGPAAGPRDPQPELGPYRLALLAGGPDRAITAAAAQLFRDGRLQGTGGTLTTAGELPITADPLEREVFETVEHEPGLSVEAMRSRVRDSAAMTALTEQMTRSGLLLEDSEATRIGLLWIVPALLAAIGVVPILTGAGDHSGSADALFVLVAVAVLATVWLIRVRPLATNRGLRLLERERRQSASQRRHPVAGEGVLLTALYGGGALWLTDPVTASALRVPREKEPNGGSGSGSGCGIGGAGCAGGGDSGGGGGCGGGGCGGGGS